MKKLIALMLYALAITAAQAASPVALMIDPVTLAPKASNFFNANGVGSNTNMSQQSFTPQYLTGTNWAIDPRFAYYRVPSMTAASRWYLTNAGSVGTNTHFTIEIRIAGGQGLAVTNTADTVNYDGFTGLLQGLTNSIWIRPEGTGWTVVQDPPGYTGSGVAVNSTGASVTNLTMKSTTFQAGQNGNVLKFTSYLQFLHPFRCDGVGAIISTNDNTVAGWGQAVMSGSAATNGNWVEWSFVVPEDMDSTVEWKVQRLKFVTGGTSTSSSTFTLGMASIADSADANPATFSNWASLTSGTLTSAAAGDAFTISNVSLTGWAAALTPGQRFKIRMSRDGAGDANNDALTTAALVLSYGATQ